MEEKMDKVNKKACNVGEDKSYWEKLIEEQAGSGNTIAKFCERRQIKFSAFKNWKYRLTKEKNGKPTMIPLQVQGSVVCDKTSQHKEEEISIIFRNGHRIVLSLSLLSSVLYEIAKLPC